MACWAVWAHRRRLRRPGRPGGRDRPLLRSAFASVREGAAAAVLIGGKAGVGKSRLIRAFTAAERGAGARVLVGGCLELGADGLPFAPFTAVLRDLVRELGAEKIAELLAGRAIQELARLAARLGEPPSGGDQGEARARPFRAGARAAGTAGRAVPGHPRSSRTCTGPGRSSRDLLAFLIRNQRALDNVLIVVTYRSDELHRTHPLRPLIAELDRIEWVERLDLRG